MDVPVTPEAAAAMLGIGEDAISAGVRLGRRGTSQEGVRGGIRAEEAQLIASGIRGGIRAGVRGGIRAGSEAGIRGGVEEGVRLSAERQGLRPRRGSGAPDLSYEFRVKLPAGLDAERPDLFVEIVHMAAPSRPLLSMVAGGAVSVATGGQVQVSELELGPGTTFLPDQDGDGVASLIEVAVSIVLVTDISPDNPDSVPTQELVQKAFLQMQDKLNALLKDQGFDGLVVVIVDLAAPDTSLSADVVKNGGFTKSAKIVFSLGCTEPGCRFSCELDGRAAEPCESPYPLEVGEGKHELKVRASDGLGNADRTPAVFAWTVITKGSATIPEEVPPPISNTASGTVKFGCAAGAGCSFRCELDGKPFPRADGSCESPLALSGLGDGDHTLKIVATDAAGNTETQPTVVSWNVDTKAPETTLKTKPPSLTNKAVATFEFSSDDVAASFSCSVDAGPSQSCSSPFTASLNEGKHTFQVAATDKAGNMDTTPAAASWEIDSSAPSFGGLNTASVVSVTQVSLSWTAASDKVTTAEKMVYEICQSTSAQGCATGFVASATAPAGTTSFLMGGLSVATRYYFVVRAVDEAGNRDSNVGEKSVGTVLGGRMAGGSAHTCAVASGGSVKCWGRGSSGQLGDGVTTGPISCNVSQYANPTPVTVSGISGVEKVLVGAVHSCSVKSGGLRCWGSNFYGQHGDGSQTDKVVPPGTDGVQGLNGVWIGEGGYHGCGVFPGGAVKCWGNNVYGQLGTGSTSGPADCGGQACSTSPVTVASASAAIGVAVGDQFSCALGGDGQVRCWGDNTTGQLGDGTTVGRGTSMVVSGVTDAREIFAGPQHACALMSDGGYKCWGSNIDGGLGIGTGSGPDTCGSAACSKTAVSSPNLTGAVQVSLGYGRGCGLFEGGTVRCWGLGTSGQLGNGSAGSSVVPVTVTGLTAPVGIASGWNHTCALQTDGKVLCWGENMCGQIGDGTTAAKSVPTGVLGFP